MVVHKGTHQKMEVIQDRNTYVVNNYHGKYFTQYYTKVHKSTQRLLPVSIQGPYPHKLPVKNISKVSVDNSKK